MEERPFSVAAKHLSNFRRPFFLLKLRYFLA
jgi:hypothetical protein